MIDIIAGFNPGTDDPLDLRTVQADMATALGAEFKPLGTPVLIGRNHYWWNGQRYVPFHNSFAVDGGDPTGEGLEFNTIDGGTPSSY